MKTADLFVKYIRPYELTQRTEQNVFLFLFILTFSQIVAFQSWQTLYTNYIVDVVGLNGAENGIIQSVREIPGLLGVSVLFFLCFFKEQVLAVISVFLLGFGVLLTGFFPSFFGLVFTTFAMSLGFHYFEVINQSITLQAFNQRVAPLVIGRLRSISALGNIIAGLFILFCATWLSFKQMYLFAGAVALLGGLLAVRRMPDLGSLPVQKKNIVLKKKYWLFYLLTFLSGGRRQIFTLFSLFLLVEKFNFSVIAITSLFLINNTINWILNPLIGKMINRFGERKLLTFQFAPAIFIFLGYAFTQSPIVASLLYILDQFTFSFNIAEKTFFQKIAESQDIAPSMAVSGTINHIAAVTVPVLGGALWIINYQLPFFLGAILAVCSLSLVQFINKEIAKAKKEA